MAVLEWTLSLLLGAVLLAALARRIGAPSPALLALGGVVVALLPNGPHFSLDPDLALALFVAPVLLAVLPTMRRQKAGHIINFSSLGGFRASAGWGIYCSTKFAMEGITEALHDELAPLGIHAGTAPHLPGPIVSSVARVVTAKGNCN
jgi:NAD(P)-dependent dehydrogenase (short-subunit alcohol dehydrogenase family)